MKPASSVKERITARLSAVFQRAHQRATLEKFKYVHVMNNGLHSAGVVEFIKRNFPEGEHGFVFPITTWATRQRLKDVAHVHSFDMGSLDPNGKYRIIIHGLFSDEMVAHLHRHPELTARCHWFVWGGDLYNVPDEEAHHAVRRGFAGVITSFDRDVYEAKYGPTRFFDVAYPHEMTEDMIDPAAVRRRPGQLHVQINNSADETTLEMLDNLARFRDEDVRITTILSYISHKQEDRRLQILRKGYAIFGEKFNPIMQFMSLPDYANHLASVDVYISNQNRQQGNGNAAFICSLGGKVFIKSDTPVYRKYADLGIRYFDTHDIAGLDFAGLAEHDPAERARSMALLKERMSEPYKVRQWGAMFDALGAR